MKTRKKQIRLLSSLLAVLTVFALLGAVSYAGDSGEGDNDETVYLEWENRFSLQSAVIHAKSHRDRIYIFLITGEREMDFSARLPDNLILVLQDAVLTIQKDCVLYVAEDADLINSHIQIHGSMIADGLISFSSGSSIDVQEDGRYAGDATLFILPSDNSDTGFPIRGIDETLYEKTEDSQGMLYTVISQTLPDDNEKGEEPVSKPDTGSDEDRRDSRETEQKRWSDFMFSRLKEIGEEFGGILIVVVLAVISARRRKKKVKTGNRKPQVAGSVSERRGGYAGKTEPRIRKREQTVRWKDPRTESFTKPEAPCIVYEQTGEDHFARDKQNRIRQLDEWLKNGLIDRAEYAVLKSRYERDL